MAVDGISGAGNSVEAALRHAASATGVDFGFLVKTAKRESGFNASARAPTSSAAGLFQFIEQTWLATLKRHGANHGYGRYAALIQQGSDGRYKVSGADDRRAVMNLRYDPQAASVMAASLASDHAAYLRGRVGREPSGGELYAAHFLGPEGAAKLIDAAHGAPHASAASLFPAAAAANRSVFFRGGRALSAGELYGNLTSTVGSAVAAPSPEVDPGQAAFADYAGARLRERERQESLLVDLLLSGSGYENSAGSAFSSEIFSLLIEARNERP
jgi:hypothetical protein